MPELPEVETVRRGLAPVLEGRRLTRVDLRRPDLRVPFTEGFVQVLTGQRVEALERRAKYLLMKMGNGWTAIIHLGMSGRFLVAPPGDAATDAIDSVKAGTTAAVTVGEFVHAAAQPGTHDHVIFETEDGARIVYSDHRRFGLMVTCETEKLAEHALLSGIGMEPLSDDLTAAWLGDRLCTKHTPVKAALLDQKIVAGLGNIYVCEALWRARISPRRMAYSIPGKRAERLVPAIKDVLAAAIEAGGSTLRDYAQANGDLGYFQHSFDVYGREGEPCRRAGCAGTVGRIVQSNRSTFFCPKCQR
jgi:formamidopyrimidine-DNA glycosylase